MFHQKMMEMTKMMMMEVMMETETETAMDMMMEIMIDWNLGIGNTAVLEC